MIISKLPETPTTIFSIMTQMANEYNAINLSQGFPEFSVSPVLKELLGKYISEGFNQYAPAIGVKPLRDKICAKISEESNYSYNPDTEITITSGATQALYTAISAFVHPGDEVVVFEPAYDSYVPAIRLNGGIPVFVTLNYPDFKVDWNMVQSKITNKTRMIIVNTPHNPSGTLFSDSDLRCLAALVKNTDIILIGDEVYEHIIFDGKKHISLASIPELASRSIIISSFGKTFHITGWKVGYCTAPAELMAEFRKLHQYTVFSVNTPVQYALAEFLNYKDEYQQLSAFYQKKRDFFIHLLEGTSFKIKPSDGTFFQSLDYSNISNEDDYTFAVRLTKEHGVASIPLSVFYNERPQIPLIRFCFAKSDETLEKGAERLRNLK